MVYYTGMLQRKSFIKTSLPAIVGLSCLLAVYLLEKELQQEKSPLVLMLIAAAGLLMLFITRLGGAALVFFSGGVGDISIYVSRNPLADSRGFAGRLYRFY
ncbi:MAG TPA: hypothetical protein VFS36_14630 [Chitinophagaceae bacterium]|nr:hypothetical protein [Chitinophagaceae bacterium]